jgi:hypothetical protein
MSIAIKHFQTRLCEFLENYLHSIESKGATAPEWLHNAIYGLHALRYGETHFIFRARKTGFSFAPHVKDTWLLKFRQDIAKSEHWDEKELNAALRKAVKMYNSAIKNKN